MIPSLYLRLAGYGLIALLLIGTGWKVGANHWQRRYEALERQGWQQKAQGEEAARKVVEKQLADAKATAQNNAQVMHDLQDTTAAIVADRDRTRALVDRMLAAAARSRPTGRDVPKASDRSATPDTSQAGSHVEIGELLTDAADECRRNSAQLNALIAELKPQL